MVRPLLGRVGIHVKTLDNAWKWLVAFIRELVDSRTTGMAAELAFWLFLSLLPLAAVAGLVLARLAMGSERVPELLATLPPETRTLIQDQLATVAAWNGGKVAAPAAVVFLWLASGGLHAMFDVLEVKAGVSRSWWKKRLIALTTCIGLSLGVALIALLLTGLDRAGALVRGAWPWELPPTSSKVYVAGRMIMGLVTAVGLVSGLYTVGVPSKARLSRVVLPGALLAVAMQALLGYGYAFYLSKVGVNSAYQAGLSIIGVTMIALYLFALALLVGAELNYVIREHRVHP